MDSRLYACTAPFMLGAALENFQGHERMSGLRSLVWEMLKRAGSRESTGAESNCEVDGYCVMA